MFFQVPKSYSLLGYNSHDTHASSSGYVAPKLAKPLRTGAEVSIINLCFGLKPKHKCLFMFIFLLDIFSLNAQPPWHQSKKVLISVKTNCK